MVRYLLIIITFMSACSPHKIQGDCACTLSDTLRDPDLFETKISEPAVLSPVTKKAQANHFILRVTPKPEKTLSTGLVIYPGKDLGTFPRAEKYHNIVESTTLEDTGPRDLELLRKLRIEVLKVWLDREVFVYGDDVDRERIFSYFDTGAGLSRELLVTLTGHEDLDSGRLPVDSLESQLVQILSVFKKKYPEIRYIEALNEYIKDTDWGDTALYNRYFRYYRAYAGAVREVNKRLKPKVPLMIGGTAQNFFNKETFSFFLDSVAAYNVPLDFMSYHQYHFLDYTLAKPASVHFESRFLRKWLGERGLNDKMPVFITEYGIFPQGGIEGTRDRRADILTQAAGMASTGYYYVTQGDPNYFPMHWVVKHPQNDRKNLLARDRDGIPTPYFNMVIMQSMLKKHRVESCFSEDVCLDGIGLYAFAARDSSGLSVMLWNYQWVGGRTSYEVNLTFGDLPAEIRGRQMILNDYKISADQCNYTADVHKAFLEPSGKEAVTMDENFSREIHLGVNEICLLDFAFPANLEDPSASQ